MSQLNARHLLAVFFLACLLLPAGRTRAGTPTIGAEVADFSLSDFRGKQYALSDLKDKQLVVIAFLGTECPLAKLYAPRLNTLAEEFSDRGVAFLAINSNRQDSITELAAYSRIHKLRFPMLKDTGNRVADQLGAVRTPEVFVLDQQSRIQYHGRIDDQYGVGYIREASTRNDLQIALEELLDGKPVSQPVTEAVGCFIGRIQEPQSEAKVTYSNQIARLLQRRCVQCHREGDIAPFALQDYDEVAGWAETIAEVVGNRRMPPWHANPDFGHFANERLLSEEEKQLIYQWVEAGAPQGDPSMLPEPAEFTEGWQLSQAPDQIVYMTDEPFEVPAEGTVRYQYFDVDPGFTEDKWVKALEVQPGNRAVVHHILVFAITPGQGGRDFGGGVRGFLGGYVPGMRAEPLPDGMAKRIPAGSKLVFQLHYTPIGSVQLDRSKIGFVFTDPDEVTHEVQTVSAFQPYIRIPKNEGNHLEVTKTRITQPAQLLSFTPHMHLRGKAFRYEMRRPDSEDWETLLDVPQYDFNWQTNYRLAEPIEAPAGTYMKCVAHYDNSEKNLSNPNPSETVRWGDQTWEEMLIGYFDIAVARNQQPEEQTTPEKRAEEFILQMDKNDDLQLQSEELPLQMRLLLSSADKDKDGSLSLQEVIDARQRRNRR